jgi:hypothetical protein
MERVIVSGAEDRPTFYFNNVDLALLEHYCGTIPEDFSFGVVSTDELDEGTVALEGGHDLPDENRVALVRYWEHGVGHARMLQDVEVAMARKGVADDEPVLALVTDEGIAVMTVDEVMAFEDDDDSYVIEFTPDEDAQ